MYYQTRLIVLDAISEMKFNLMESSIKIAIFSFFFFLQQRGKNILVIVYSSFSFVPLPPLTFFSFFCATVLEKACIRKTIPPLLRSISFLSS